jgi:phosphomannomutase
MVDLSSIRPLRVVIDAANGMAGHTAHAVFGEAAGLAALPIEILPLYFELDGTFPNHEANPLVPENLHDLQATVVKQGADLGLAFDGDADRCFVVDERGEPVSPSTLAAIVANLEIERARGMGETDVTVLVGHLASRMVTETVLASGARASRTKVGHSLIKAQMLEENAVFGAEHSAHYYFRDFWFADSGLLAAMHFIKSLGESAVSASVLAAEYAPYPGSGEINLEVTDVTDALTRVKAVFEARGQIDEFDGLTVSHTSEPDWWWFNLRSSNTEPLLRLNAEAASEAQLQKIIAEVLPVIQS